MVLDKIKTGKAYESASYLAGEAEWFFFSLARPISDISYRFGGFSSDADTEFYKGLVVVGAVVSVGVAGTIIHYLTHRKYRAPSDIADRALEKTVDIAGDAVYSATNVVNSAGRVVNSASQTIRDSARDLSEKFK